MVDIYRTEHGHFHIGVRSKVKSNETERIGKTFISARNIAQQMMDVYMKNNEDTHIKEIRPTAIIFDNGDTIIWWLCKRKECVIEE